MRNAEWKRRGDKPVTRSNRRVKWNLLNMAVRAISSIVSGSLRFSYLLTITRLTARSVLSSIAQTPPRSRLCTGRISLLVGVTHPPPRPRQSGDSATIRNAKYSADRLDAFVEPVDARKATLPTLH